MVEIVLCFMFLANKGDAFWVSQLLSMCVHICQHMCRRVHFVICQVAPPGHATRCTSHGDYWQSLTIGNPCDSHGGTSSIVEIHFF